MLSLSDNMAELLRRAQGMADEITQGLLPVVQMTCLDGAEHAREVGQFKDVTGETRRSIRFRGAKRTERGAEGSFGTESANAARLEKGTAPHEIRPKFAGGDLQGPTRRSQGRRAAGDIGTTRVALKWTAGGQVHFARIVHHPGGRSFPFMGPAAIKAEAVLHMRTELLCERAIARLSK